MRLILKMMALTVLIATGLTLGQVESKAGPDAPPVRISIYFQVGQTTLTSEAEAVLDETAKTVKEGGTARLIIVGHADKSGSEAINQRIAAARADVVKQGLIDRGIEADAIGVSAMTSRSNGEPEPGFISERRTDVIIEPAKGSAPNS